MSEMIERVGRAIHDALALQRIDPNAVRSFSGIIPPIRWGAVGAAAIEAMREPTPEMLDEAWAEAHDENAAGVWREMIGEALK